ncbi:MAG: hypothetical protein GY943_25160 [Chloroflexi bacterium]|nr:hypothetical protein [Chloroflexota bacterium]
MTTIRVNNTAVFADNTAVYDIVANGFPSNPEQFQNQHFPQLTLNSNTSAQVHWFHLTLFLPQFG